MNAREEQIIGLRNLADFYEANPNFPLGYLGDSFVFVATREEVVNLARGFGNWDKHYIGDTFYLVKKMSENLKLNICVPREQVCRKVVSGKRMVEKDVTQVIRKEMVEEEIFDWVCDEPLLSPKG